MQQRNIFAGPYLDRAADLRQDPAWFAAALADERSRAIPVWNSRSLITEGDTPLARYLELRDLPPERRNSADLILRGGAGATSYFAYDIESIEPPVLLPGTRFEDLRLVAALLLWALKEAHSLQSASTCPAGRSAELRRAYCGG